MDAVVVAEKKLAKKYLFGCISNGGAVIEISNGKYLKIVALNNNFATLQILESGIGTPIKTQSWKRTKKVIVKAKKKEKLKEKLTVEEKVQKKSVFDY